MTRVEANALSVEVFDDSFIDYLFDLVEQTRHMQDETFNYSVIKLIVCVLHFGPEFALTFFCRLR